MFPHAAKQALALTAWLYNMPAPSLVSAAAASGQLVGLLPSAGSQFLAEHLDKTSVCGSAYPVNTYLFMVISLLLFQPQKRRHAAPRDTDVVSIGLPFLSACASPGPRVVHVVPVDFEAAAFRCSAKLRGSVGVRIFEFHP